MSAVAAPPAGGAMVLALNDTKLRLWTDFERIDVSRPPKREDHGWLHGTRYWDALTDEQRLELLWLEHAHTVSAMIWFKEELPALYTRYMQKFGERIAPEVRAYMTAYCEEECGEAKTFRRYLAAAGLPLYERPDLLELIPNIERVHPIAGILCTYMVQGIMEEAALRQDAEHLDPYTRALMRRHHLAEARHLAFSKWLCESMLEDSSKATKARTGHLTRGYMGNAVRRFTFHPEIAQYLSFDLGIDPNDAEELESVWRSENNLRLNGERFQPMLEWVRWLGIVKPDWGWTTDGRLPLAHFSRWSQNGPFTAIGKARKARLAELVAQENR